MNEKIYVDVRRLAENIKQNGGIDLTGLSDQELLQTFLKAFKKIGEILKDDSKNPDEQMVEIGEEASKRLTQKAIVRMILEYRNQNPNLSYEDARRIVFERYQISDFQLLRKE